MKSLFSILLIVSLFFSCYKEVPPVSGSYVSPDQINGKFPSFGRYSVGLMLDIREDSTYTFSTCAQVSDGTWKVENSKVVLKCQKRRFKIDSFNNMKEYEKGRICGKDLHFEIKKNKLFREEMSKEGKIGFLLVKQ